MVKATIEDVAVEAGVSVATVDRVLNGRAAVRPQTAERVEKAIRRLNYQPDRLAARLARAMDRWRVLAEPYRSAAREAIARVAAKTDLSNDVREVVSRALAD